MAALLTRVKSKLFIVAHRRTWGLLDGEYASVFRGRSLDYDDLREYIPGDEIRDIDWKATARHGAPLVKRYVATRKQTVLLLVDTGRSMAAMAPSGEPKKDIAIQIAGMLGYLAVRHGDLVGLISGDGESTRMLEPAAGEANLERLLRVIDRASTLEAPPSRFSAQLHYLAEHVRRRMLIVAVTDDGGLGSDDDPLLRRLHAQHEVLWVVVADADPTRFDPRADASEVTDGSALPGAVRGANVSRRHTSRLSRADARRPISGCGGSGSRALAWVARRRSWAACSRSWRGSAAVHVDDPFYPPMTYHWVWTLLAWVAILAVLAWAGFIWWRTRRVRPTTPAGPVPIHPGWRLARAKHDTMTRIDQIVWECEQGRVDARTSHRELSAAVRAFIDDVSGATTSRMTLSDLGSRGPGLAPVTHVVLQLYPGEFGPDPARPIRPAAEAAKAVVAQWH